MTGHPVVARGDEVPLVPPFVYVPIGAFPDGDDVEIAFRQTEDGRLALLAYTALDRLIDCCGPFQPWAVLETESLGLLYEQHPWDVMHLDAEIPVELREGPPAPPADRTVVRGQAPSRSSRPAG